MRSHSRFLKHPLHPMLVMFPVALFPLLLFLDVVQWIAGSQALWTAAFWVTLAGLVMTVVAIIPGVVDMAHIPDGTRAHRIGMYHAVVGTLILVLYAVALWIRWPLGGAPDTFAWALGIDLVGTLFVSVQGWLGGELVYRHHVGVEGADEGGMPVRLEARSGEEGGRRRQPGAGRLD